MPAFSDDGQWWYDQQQWIPTSQVLIPDLAATDFERSGKLAAARAEMKKRSNIVGASWVEGLTMGGSALEPLIGVPLGVVGLGIQVRAFRDYRQWTLEQLDLATTYLVGPGESMVAGEVALRGSYTNRIAERKLGLAVTQRRVLILSIDQFEGQPRSVVLATLARDVNIHLVTGPFGNNPTLRIRSGPRQWDIRGTTRVFQPQPVIVAWRRAATAATP